MTQGQSKPSRPADATRRALIDAAIDHFGRNGFDATSIRTIAQSANTNVASIAYHFGGKDGLRLACGEEIAGRMDAMMQTADRTTARTADQAAAALEATVCAFARLLALNPDTANLVQFLVREISEQSPAIDVIYEQVMAARHADLCHLWELATGMPAESDETRLTVFSMIGQALYFRIGQNVVTRRMRWNGYDASRVDQITAILVQNLRATIAATRKVTP